MSRVVAVVLATLGGLALLLTFKTSPSGAKKVTLAPLGHQPAATAPPATTAPGSPATTAPAGSSPPPTTAPSGPAKSYDGQTFFNQYGPVQVRVVIQGGRITDVQALQMPVDHQRSAEISQFAEPQLRSEVLQAQSANIDLVSGATYTSENYAQSLQSALAQAHG
jgi:uncharacterized protein with FMN-binding domain